MMPLFVAMISRILTAPDVDIDVPLSFLFLESYVYMYIYELEGLKYGV